MDTDRHTTGDRELDDLLVSSDRLIRTTASWFAGSPKFIPQLDTPMIFSGQRLRMYAAVRTLSSA